MKKLLILVLVILFGWGVWHFLQSNSSVKVENKTSQVSASHPDLSNATFQFEDGDITLKNGQADTAVIPGGELTQETTLTDDVAYGDLNNDGKEDAAALLVQQGSGSGVFIYLAAYTSGLVSYKGSNAVFIGDRISPKSISIKSGVVTVNFLDRKANEPFSADPTVPTTKQFVFKAGTLVEK